MKTKGLVVFIVLCIISLLFISTASAKSIELRFNYSMPLKKSIAKSWHWYGDEVEKQTNGKVKFQYFPLGGLFKPKQTRDNMIAGTADICNLSISTEGPRMPLASMTSLPTVYFPNTVDGTIAASDIAYQLVSEFPELAKEFSDFKVLAYQYLTAYGVFTKTPTYLPSALKGQKIRAAALHAEFVKSVGGGPVNIVPPKVYMSLKTGVIDGSIMSVSQIADYKLWEIAQSFTDTYMGRTLFAIIMNKESWNALPKDVQQVMDNMSTSLVKKGAEIMHAETDLGEKLFRENGGTIYQLTPEQEKAWYDAKLPLEKNWLENMRSKGMGDVAERLLKRFKDLAADKTKDM